MPEGHGVGRQKNRGLLESGARRAESKKENSARECVDEAGYEMRGCRGTKSGRSHKGENPMPGVSGVSKNRRGGGKRKPSRQVGLCLVCSSRERVEEVVKLGGGREPKWFGDDESCLADKHMQRAGV